MPSNDEVIAGIKAEAVEEFKKVFLSKVENTKLYFEIKAILEAAEEEWKNK